MTLAVKHSTNHFPIWTLLLLAIYGQVVFVYAESLSIAFFRHQDGSTLPNISLSGPMQKVQGIIDGLHKLSSCNKIATAHLLESCSSLPDPSDPRSTDMILDKPKRIYVARLALCEISEAPGVKWPRGCRGLDLALHNDAISEESIDHCVNDLYFATSGNMWVSYSSAKKHAAGICQSVRFEVEKDEQIRTYQALFDATAAVSQELNESKEEMVEIKDAFTVLRLGLIQFLTDVRIQHNEMLAAGRKDWQQIEIHTSDVLSNLVIILGQLQKATEELSRHDDLMESMVVHAGEHHSAELFRANEQTESIKAQFLSAIQAAFNEIQYISSGAITDLNTASELSTGLVSSFTNHISQLAAAAKDVEKLRVDLAFTKTQQDSLLSKYEASLNRTVDSLRSLSSLPGLLGLPGLYHWLPRSSIPLFISTVLLVFAVIHACLGLPWIVSSAAALSLSILGNTVFGVFKESTTQQFSQITVSERVVWGTGILLLLAVLAVFNAAK